MELLNAHLAYFNRPLGQDLGIRSGEVTLLLGPSGCGKTSLLKAMAGFADLKKGEILTQSDRIAMLLQNPFNQIIMQHVRDELLFPLKNAGITGAEAVDRMNRTAGMLQIAHLLDRDIATLSFGETQLTMIAATCLTPADCYLFDEPTSHLDPPLIHLFYACIRDLAKEGKCVCLTSQSPDEYRFADRIILMDNGQIMFSGTRFDCPESLINHGVIPDSILIETKLKEIAAR